MNQMSYVITDSDARVFLQEAPLHRAFLRSVLGYSAVTIITVLLGVATLAAFAPKQTGAIQAPSLVGVTTAQPLADAAASTPTPAPSATPLPVTLPTNTLALAELNISAPITWNVGFTQNAMNAALKQGVIHLAGTPVPGQQGMAAIAGHSSNYYWVKGDFNDIFAPLTKAQLGQRFELNYEGVMYQYQIHRIYEVKPNNTEVLSNNDKTGIRLITCTPVGTALRRLIVEAEQIFPDPASAAPFNGTTFSGALPGN
jgi:LPXTG-site transpeptidase (sortase) family protein